MQDEPNAVTALAVRARGGDPEALAELCRVFDRHLGAIVRWCLYAEDPAELARRVRAAAGVLANPDPPGRGPPPPLDQVVRAVRELILERLPGEGAAGDQALKETVPG